MITLLGFKAYGDYSHEYQIVGDDVLRLAALLGFPVALRSSTVAYVTIYPQGVDNDFERGDFGAGATTGGDARPSDQYNLISDGRVP